MSLSTKYSPAKVENKWYQHWMSQKFFGSVPNPDKEPYCIVIPPPNVTGILHMGHILNNTIQDILVRKARMEGKEACWVPGTDHASIATEAKVVAMLKERGIKKSDITREEFVNFAWEWTEKYGGIILEQLKKMGCSCDWDRTRFTMEPKLSESVIRVFVDLYHKGLIYRGIRMVNWDPLGKTALSDDEVNYKEVNSKLYFIQYAIEGENQSVTIATTRPETILGDTAIAINPDDPRYQLKGKKALVPLINRVIPIIEDNYVDPEFGTGCLKITPSHDPNDYEIGMRHNLESIDILNDDGTLNDNAEILIGEDRFEARKKIVKLLENSGNLLKVKEYQNKVGFSERTDAVIEPKISTQWFVKMDQITKPALENVMNNTVQLHPSKFKNMYRTWMENVRDWCISRQLWWGHRIPAYYLPGGDIVVAESPEEALKLAREKEPTLAADQLKQDEDVLDTWFSSWLWPISVFDGILEPDNEDVNYYYPTNDLVTAPEILFFWVARMIISGYEYRGEYPFKNVYLTGIVRDGQGRKMSKSLGNSPDPIELMDEYGADAVRTGMLLSSPAGNDLLFDFKQLEQGRNFANKIWNAYRLVKGWSINDDLNSDDNKIAINWFDARMRLALNELHDHFKKFRIRDAILSIYKLIWDDFCSWYLEMIKPKYQQPIDRSTYERTIDFFEDLMKILHPFMPFISEEIWHQTKNRTDNDCIMIASWPPAKQPDYKLLKEATKVFEVISSIRNLKNSKGIHKKEALDLWVRSPDHQLYLDFGHTIKKLANISEIKFTDQKISNSLSLVVQSDEFFLPLEEVVDLEQERKKLTEELDYTKGFLASVNSKLANQRFITNAPDQVVENEKSKKADAEAKIQTLEESLASL
jgi:valyl-tRNA synthetase